MHNPFGEGAFVPRSEQEPFEEVFEGYLARHVVDMEPERVGSREALAQIGGSAFGCKEVSVDRCSPHLDIDELKLERGKSIVLIGPNGGGKSTLFDGIMGASSAAFNTKHDKGGYVYGDSVHGKEKLRVSRLNQEEMLAGLDGRTTGDVLKNAQDYFVAQFPVDWENGDAYDQNLINQEAAQRIEELRGRLEGLFRMDEFADRKVEELSGGERTKLSLCMLLMSEPDVLLLDEPTNHLDLESIAKLSALLDLYTKAGVSVLSVSHVHDYLDGAGKDGVLEIKMNADKRQLIASKAPYSSYIRDRARETFTIVEGQISWPVSRGGKSGGSLLAPRTEKTTIQDSPLTGVDIPPLLPNDVWVLSGNNGSGKTKLMEAQTKRRGNDRFERAKGTSIAYLPQFWPDEIMEGNVEAFFGWIHDNVNPQDQNATVKRFVEAVQKIGFRSAKSDASSSAPFSRRKLSSFSGGEQRLLWFLAVSCFEKVDALFLDEPTNHMDRNLQQLVTKAIQDFQGAVVFSTHDLQLLDAISTDVGKKGSTMAPKNLVFEKKGGRTTVTQSNQNPADYMRSKLAGARKEARTKMAGRV